VKAGWYWYILDGSEEWTIVKVSDGLSGQSVTFSGSDIDWSIEEAKGNGEFGTRIPQKNKRMGSIAEITSQRKSATFK
jgi:hypothetical protein